MRQIILDLETTGLRVEEGHRIIEIGCLEMMDRKLTGRQFHEYLNPEREIDAGAVAIHGITNQFLENKPTFANVVPDFLSFVQEAEVIIHNAVFDVGFLNAELSSCLPTKNTITDYCRILCTLQMARQRHVGQRNSLDALCKRYSVDNSKRDLHGALLDAYLLSQVYLNMTGGQGNFFENILETRSHQEEPSEKEELHALHFPIHKVTPTSEELSEHQHYLDLLKEKGSCLWE